MELSKIVQGSKDESEKSIIEAQEITEPLSSSHEDLGRGLYSNAHAFVDDRTAS